MVKVDPSTYTPALNCYPSCSNPESYYSSDQSVLFAGIC